MKENEKIWAVKDGYLVNRDGSIYKLNWNRTGKMRKVKQSNNGIGYLYFNCNGKNVLTHRFVAECFIPNPNPQTLTQVNHKNECKSDNRAVNLEWVSAKTNVNHGSRNKRSGETNSKVLKNHPKLSKTVLQYTKDGEFVKEWVSTMEIERVLGFAHQHISACCLGKIISAYDHLWRYKDNLLS